MGEVIPFYNGDEAGEQTESSGAPLSREKGEAHLTSATSDQIRKCPKICGLSEVGRHFEVPPSVEVRDLGERGRARSAKASIFVLGSTLDQPSIAAISAGTARTLNHRTGQPWGARDES